MQSSGRLQVVDDNDDDNECGEAAPSVKTTHRPCSVLRQAATHVETQVSDEGDAARPQTAAEGSAEFVGPAISFLESQASDLAVSPTVCTHGSAHEDNSSYSATAPVAPPAAAAAVI